MTSPFIKRYLIALDRHKWIGLASLALVVGASGIVALQPNPAPVYIAEATLNHNGPPITFSATGSRILEQGKALDEQTLLADDVVEPIAQKAGVQVKDFRKSARAAIKQVGDPKAPSLQVTIRYIDDNSQRASFIVKQLMQSMVEKSRFINTERLRTIILALNQRLPAATQELRAVEQRLERYDRTEGPALLTAQNGNLLGAITASEQQQRQIQLNLEGIDAQMRSLSGKLGLNPSQAYASSALSADPIIANLRTLIYQNESAIAIQSQDLRPEHYAMVELQRKQQAYEQLLQQRAAEVIGGNTLAAPLTGGDNIRRESSLDPARQQLANTLVSLQTQRDTLQQQLLAVAREEQSLRQTFAVIPNKQLERARLEQQVVLKRALYDKMQATLVDAKAAEVETVSSLSISNPTPQIIANIKPPKSIPVILGAGVMVGLLVGGGIIFLLGAMEDKFYTLEDVREALRQRDITILGLLPLIDTQTLLASDLDDEVVEPVLLEADSPYLDFYERLRSNLRRAEGKSLKVLLFTSTVSQEGKTITAYNLAIASARAGRRTLLLEADLRNSSKAKALQVAPDPESRIEPLRYYEQLSDCIRLVPKVENLYVVPSPGPQRQAAGIIESSEIRRLLEDARGRFDFVVIDSPSLSSSNDALLLEPFTDGLVLVTRPGYTESSLLAESIDQLGASNFRLLGAVINGAEIPVQSRTSAKLESSTYVEATLVPYEDLKGIPSGARDL